MDFRRRNVSILMLALLLGTVMNGTFELSVANSLDKPIGSYPGVKADSSENCSHWVKLVTRDVVRVGYLPNGQKTINIVSIDQARTCRSFLAYGGQTGTYVIPSDVSLGKLDIELFNLDYLISEGYDKMVSLPVIVSVSASKQKAPAIAGELAIDFKGETTALYSAQSAFSVMKAMKEVICQPQIHQKIRGETIEVRKGVSTHWQENGF